MKRLPQSNSNIKGTESPFGVKQKSKSMRKKYTVMSLAVEDKSQ